MYLMITITIINNLMFKISMTINHMNNKKYNKTNTNFECGFNEKTSLKTPFSTNFFMITILFLIFDLEISLITPYILMNNLMKTSSISLMMLIATITTMLINEWLIGMMEWSK